MKNTNTANATFSLTGEVTDIYNGKNENDYLTVKVTRGNYYDLFRVACPKSAGVEVGDKAKFTGRIETFWNKEKKVSVTNLYSETVKEV